MKKLLATLAVAALMVIPARAQVVPLSLQNALSNTWVLTNVIYQTATNAYPITLQQGKGFSVQCAFAAAGAAVWTTGQVGLGWCFSADGTNYSTDTNALTWTTFTPNGATAVYSFTNIPPWVTDNARYAKILLITNNNNATAMVARLTNVLVHIKN
jgi:hypothetical protein